MDCASRMPPTATPSSPSSSSVASIARSYAIISVLQKLITFSLNQLLLRYTNPAVFGKATIQFELFLSSILFVSREGIRLSILREASANLDHNGVQRLVNLSWLPFVALLFLLLFVIYRQNWQSIFGLSLTSTSVNEEDFNMIVYYNLGALMECMSEPWYNMAGLDGLLHVRLYAEALGLISRAMVTFICMSYFEQGILSFGIAQLVYGVIYSTSLIALSYFARNALSAKGDEVCNEFTGNKIRISIKNNKFLPQLLYLPSSWSFSSLWSFVVDNLGSHSLVLATAMTGTVIMKHISTEADKIILSIYASHYNQGIYSVASNYCSLVARLVFFPIEEACRLTFPRLVGEINRITRSMELQKEGVFNFIGSCRCKVTEERIEIRSKLRDIYFLLFALLQLVALVGMIFSIFGPFFARTFVNLILGSRWYSEEIVNTISSFCFYILIMGLNGVSEAFCQSVIQNRHMHILTIGLCLSSIIFALSAATFIKSMSTSGIVIAIAVGMLVRLLFNIGYIYKSSQDPTAYFSEMPWPTLASEGNDNQYKRSKLDPPLRAMPLGKESFFIPMNLVSTVIVIVALLYQSSVWTYGEGVSILASSSTPPLIYREIMHIITGCICLLAIFVQMYWFKKKEIFHLFMRISSEKR